MSERTITIRWSHHYRYKIENDVEIPESEGIYQIFVELKSEKLRRIYIGTAEDLRRRYNEHLQNTEENECLKEYLKDYVCWIWYALLTNEGDRKDAEQAIYDKYTHKCNQVKPTGSGRGYNIKIIEIKPKT